MLGKCWKIRWIRYALVLLAVVGLGYSSNAVTLSACERNTSIWLKDLLSEKSTDWPHRRANSDPAEFTFPWIVTVNYEWAVSSTGAEWGTRYYFTLFGLPFALGNSVSMMA